MEEITSYMKRLLVIGGTGFIGRNLTIKAIQQGFIVTVVSLNKPASYRCIDSVEYIDVDIVDRVTLQQKLKDHKFEYVINISGYVDHSNYSSGGRKVIDTHFIGLLNLLDSIDLTSLQRFIQIGSSDEYGSTLAPQNETFREAPISPYSFSKVASTHLLQMLYRTEKLPVVVLRLFLVYGPGQNDSRFLPKIIQGCLSGDTFPVSNGKQLRDFCFIDDVTQGIMKALIKEKAVGEVINIASGKPVPIRDVVNHVCYIVGSGSPEFGMVKFRSGENMELYADIDKAHKLLGWKQHVGLMDGIIKTVDYFLDSYPRFN